MQFFHSCHIWARVQFKQDNRVYSICCSLLLVQHFKMIPPYSFFQLELSCLFNLSCKSLQLAITQNVLTGTSEHKVTTNVLPIWKQSDLTALWFHKFLKCHLLDIWMDVYKVLHKTNFWRSVLLSCTFTWHGLQLHPRMSISAAVSLLLIFFELIYDAVHRNTQKGHKQQLLFNCLRTSTKLTTLCRTRNNLWYKLAAELWASGSFWIASWSLSNDVLHDNHFKSKLSIFQFRRISSHC